MKKILSIVTLMFISLCFVSCTSSPGDVAISLVKALDTKDVEKAISISTEEFGGLIKMSASNIRNGKKRPAVDYKITEKASCVTAKIKGCDQVFKIQRMLKGKKTGPAVVVFYTKDGKVYQKK